MSTQDRLYALFSLPKINEEHLVKRCHPFAITDSTGNLTPEGILSNMKRTYNPDDVTPAANFLKETQGNVGISFLTADQAGVLRNGKAAFNKEQNKLYLGPQATVSDALDAYQAVMKPSVTPKAAGPKP